MSNLILKFVVFFIASMMSTISAASCWNGNENFNKGNFNGNCNRNANYGSFNGNNNGNNNLGSGNGNNNRNNNGDMNIGNQAFGCGYQASECSFPTCGC
jgi:hypothetical protein